MRDGRQSATRLSVPNVNCSCSTMLSSVPNCSGEPPVMAEFATALPSTQSGPVSIATRVSVRPRLDSVDLLRGMIMMLMLLDHTRAHGLQLPARVISPV